MVNETDPVHILHHRLQRTESVDDAIETLREIRVSADTGVLSPTDADNLTVDAFRIMQQLTASNPDAAEPLVLDDLVPFCLSRPGMKPEEDRQTRHHARRCLVDWMEQYAAPRRGKLRSAVLHRIQINLESDDPVPALYAVAAIGYREPSIEGSVWELAERNDNKNGDTALRILGSIGIPCERERGRLLEKLHWRMSKRYNLELVAALRHMADPRSLDHIEEHWLRPFNAETWRRRGHLVLSLITDIADQAEECPAVQKRIWNTISSLYRAHPDVLSADLRLGGGLAPRCDYPSVVSDLIQWLVDVDKPPEQAAHVRWLYYLRLGECVRPRQLMGWQVSHSKKATTALLGDASQDTKSTERWLSTRAWHKEKAWDTLLSMGHRSVLELFESSVASETNPYMRSRIMERLACCRLDPLPPTLKQWITEPYSYQVGSDKSEEWTYRFSSIRLAQSAATTGAFDVLCRSGITIGGETPKRTVVALADVATYLAKAGDVSAVSKLVDMVVGIVEQHQRVAAAGALELVASSGLLPVKHAHTLITAITDPDRDIYERACLVAALGHLDIDVAQIPSDLLDKIRAWAQQEDNRLGSCCLEFLARRGILLGEPHLLTSLLGLRSARGQWIAPQDAERIPWAPRIVAMLYQERPDEFAPAVASLVLNEEWTGVVQLLHALQTIYSETEESSIPSEISEALLQRARRRQTATAAEPELFSYLGRLIPETLTNTGWDELWDNWLADARVALADALGQVTPVCDETCGRAERLLLLLAEDPVYAVRRSANRSYARIAPTSFARVCASWSSRDAPVERRRQAAEGCEWLPRPDQQQPDLFDDIYERVASDTEPSVRRIATHAGRARRERQWADDYLTRVRAAEKSQGYDTLEAWRYGQALTRIGDDTCLRILQRDYSENALAPNVQHWLGRMTEELEKNWRKVTQKWSDPWLTVSGRVEQGRGVMIHPSGREQPVHYSLWLLPSPVPSEQHSWGGAFIGLEFFSGLTFDRFTLRLEDGKEGEAIATHRSNNLLIFTGTALYPQ